ncbi:helix-turn-helix transcriptional regulator [Pararhodobacter sp.]|uniref:helix-turn-helix transcriptional regulator n=1 Tax=Pararhodobacter sp. TaxID=2127056 RepID=UPI002AFF6B80|nr:helix-turn-helix transcriptional regulator [Pararhodobacter sp.]
MNNAVELQEFAAQLRTHEDPFSVFQSFIEDHGGKGYFYGFAGMKSDFLEFNYSKALFSHHTYGDDWAKTSGPERAIDHDTTIARLLAGEDYVEWVPENISEYVSHYTPEQHKQVSSEHGMGLKFGCSIAIDRSAFGLSGMGFWTTAVTSGHEFRQLWSRYGAQICQGAAMLDMHIRKDQPNLLIGLTAREIDCISWLAAGLRPSEICWKLQISEKTFEKHISNAKQKLKSRTRDNAVAKAILFGLIKM